MASSSAYFQNIATGRTNIIAVGKTGAGKSATLNSILRCSNTYVEPFGEYSGPVSGTNKCESRHVTVFDISLRVVDTVGFFDTRAPFVCSFAKFDETRDTDEKHKLILDEFNMALHKCHGEVHAVLYVIDGSERFTSESIKTLEIIASNCGTSVVEHCVFVITKQDKTNSDLEATSRKSVLWKRVSKYFEGRNCTPPKLDQFVQLNNKSSAPETQVRSLFAAIAGLQYNNKGKPFTSAAYRLAQQEMDRERARVQLERERKERAAIGAKVAEATRLLRAQNEEAERRARDQRLRQMQLHQAMVEQERLRRARFEAERDAAMLRLMQQSIQSLVLGVLMADSDSDSD